MRKLFIEGVVIFISILASLSVDNMRDLSDEQKVLNEAVTTLAVSYTHLTLPTILLV